MQVDLLVLITFFGFLTTVVAQIFFMCFFSDILKESVSSKFNFSLPSNSILNSVD